VRIGTHELHLTSFELSVLCFLAANPGRLVTRDEIQDHLWGADYAAESNVIDRHVRSLRAKLRDDWRPRFIATVHGLGYRFELPPQLGPPQRSPGAAPAWAGQQPGAHRRDMFHYPTRRSPAWTNCHGRSWPSAPQTTSTLGMTIYWSQRHSAVIRGLVWWWLSPIVVVVLLFIGLFLTSQGLDELANRRLGRRV
jgi:hypothetical protein